MTLADELKTSCRIVGQDQVDDLEALCVLYGRRPFQLVADWVLERIQEEREDPQVMDYLLLMRSAREERRAQLRTDRNVIDLETRRSAR